MFIVYVVLFLLGFWLFGFAFNVVAPWQGLTFLAGLLSISFALWLVFRNTSSDIDPNGTGIKKG